jgi:hypothetical protein
MTVFIVEVIYFIEEYYKCESLEHVFSTQEKAQAWIDSKQAEQAANRASYERLQEIQARAERENPSTYEPGPHPPQVKSWGAGIAQKDITPEMRAERNKAKEAIAAFNARLSQACEAHAARVSAAVDAVWDGLLASGEEKKAHQDLHRPPYEPTQYIITPMVVDAESP